MNLSVAEIAEAVGARVSEGAVGGVRVTGFTWDSRSVVPGDLYIALPGERVDGHDFADDAVEAGAVAVLASRELGVGAPVLAVSDVAAAFTRLAAFWRGMLSGTVIGLTGSSGKTTTKNLVRDVLAHDRTVVATKGNQNNELGVPATLLSADEDTQLVVVEMGMRGRGQIAELAEIALPDWGLVTNVGVSHVELLGSREEIARAKAELFEALPEGSGIAFVNAADDYAPEMREWARLEGRGVQVVLYDGSGHAGAIADGASGSADDPTPDPIVWASDVALDGEGRSKFTLNAVGFGRLGLDGANGSHECALELRGLHNVSNACAAAAVGLAAGMSLEACCEALAAARPEQGRQQVHHAPGELTLIDDSYNANPDSMAASLATFAAIEVPGKRIAVLGDMLELGNYARESHEKAGELVAASGVDALVCVGELSRGIARAARLAGMDPASIAECGDADEALARVRELAAPGDAVLVKASHSIGLARVVEGLVA